MAGVDARETTCKYANNRFGGLEEGRRPRSQNRLTLSPFASYR